MSLNLALNLDHNYTVVNFLSEGAQGKTYLIRDEYDTVLVIKFTLIHQYAIDQIVSTKKVLNILRGVHHPNIVRIYEIGTIYTTDNNYDQINTLIGDDDKHLDIAYVIMEYIEGSTMNNHLEPDQLQPLMFDVMSALKTFDRYNIRHGDMNFQNVIYNIKTNKYVVIDFDFSSIITKPQEDAYFETDIDFVNDNMNRYIFYPEDDSMITDDDDEYIKFMLPNTSLMNKYCNYASSTKRKPLDHYISILSILLGDEPVIINFENDVNEVWKYGIKQ